MLEKNSFILKNIRNSAYQTIKLAGDASTREYFRIQPDQTNDSYVIMVRDKFSDKQTDPFLNIQSFFQKQGIAVPQVIDFDASKGLILLEDLGDITLEQLSLKENKQETLKFYKLAIDELIKIHSLKADESCLAFNISFNVKKFLYEMNFTKKHLFQKLIQFSISEKLETGLQKEFITLCSQIDELPKKVCHRDFHSRNIMAFHQRAYAIDFQDARLGPFEYDLASLIEDPYVSLTESDKQTLQKYYLEQMNMSYQESFLKNYRLLILQRCFKACGSFASFFNNKKDNRYLQYLPKTLLLIRSQISDKQPYFKNLIDDSGVLNIDYKNI